MQSEDKIRDVLSKNLNLFGLNLELVSTEFYIPQKNTTRSFIDILAKDDINNYVIIEVKRSNQSAREAIHEIFKYTEAIIDNFRVSPEEVKAIIVSTEWKELYVPFSAFVNESTYTLAGYNLNINDILEIQSLTPITPCKTKNGRLFSNIQKCCLYADKTRLKKGIESHKVIYKEKNIPDYVLVILKAAVFDEERFRDDLEEMMAKMLGENKSKFKGNFDAVKPHPFMIYSSFQRLTKEEYLNIIKRDQNEYDEIIEYISDMDDDDAIESLENSVIGNVKPWFFSDDTEIGYPAKFSNKILEEEKWEIIDIIRSESLQANSLLSDDKIISEIKGETGVANVILRDACSLNHKAKLNGIKDRSYNCLKHNLIWQNDINHFFNEILELKEGELKISIYSPCNILLTIIYMLVNEDSFAWMPSYILELVIKSKTKVYLGNFHWSGELPSFEYIVEKYYNSNPANILNAMIWGGHEHKNCEIMEDLGLSYESYLIENPNSDSQQIYHYSKYRFTKRAEVKNGLIDLINSSEDFVSKLVLVYKTFYHKVSIQIDNNN